MTHREELIEAIEMALGHAFWNGVSAGHDLTPRHESNRLEAEAKEEGLTEILKFVDSDRRSNERLPSFITPI